MKDNKRNNRLRVNIGQEVEEAKQTFSKQQSEALKEEIKRAEDNFNKFSEDRPYQENYIRKNVNIVEFVALPNCLDIFKNFYKDYKDNPIFDYKKETYETVFDKNESVIGHYYRNLYRIMKIIQETVFDDSSIENNEKEKKKYRGILRAQLSSFELLMLFYNVVYSDKGEISKNF
ncbi:putative phage abortive infection protein [Niallia circulans]